MKKLQILGPGCRKCQRLAANTEAAAEALGLTYELVKVTDIKQITAFGAVLTPVLVVDGVVKVTGEVPDVEALKKLLS